MAKRKIRAEDREILEKALCTIVDYEWAIQTALTSKGYSYRNIEQMCEALRALVDDGFQP